MKWSRPDQMKRSDWMILRSPTNLRLARKSISGEFCRWKVILIANPLPQRCRRPASPFDRRLRVRNSVASKNRDSGFPALVIQSALRCIVRKKFELAVSPQMVIIIICSLYHYDKCAWPFPLDQRPISIIA
jgi:hypothetical protein